MITTCSRFQSPPPVQTSPGRTVRSLRGLVVLPPAFPRGAPLKGFDLVGSGFFLTLEPGSVPRGWNLETRGEHPGACPCSLQLSLGAPSGCTGPAKVAGADKPRRAPASPRSPAPAPRPARRAPARTALAPASRGGGTAGGIRAGARRDGAHGPPSRPLPQTRTPAPTRHERMPQGPPSRLGGEERQASVQLTSHPGPDKGYELLGPARSRACVRRSGGQGWQASASPRTTNPRSLWALPDSFSQQVGAHVARLGDSKELWAPFLSREYRAATLVSDSPRGELGRRETEPCRRVPALCLVLGPPRSA